MQLTDPTAAWDTGGRWILDSGSVIVVSKGLVARGAPAVGDFFVRYPPEGYESWSPSRVFLDGYAPLDAAAAPVAAVGLLVERREDGTNVVRSAAGDVIGELPPDHRLVALLTEQIEHLQNEVLAALAEPPAPEEQQELPPVVRSRVPVRTAGRGSAVQRRVEPAAPGRPPTPEQARVTPPTPPPAPVEAGAPRPPSRR